MVFKNNDVRFFSDSILPWLILATYNPFSKIPENKMENESKKNTRLRKILRSLT